MEHFAPEVIEIYGTDTTVHVMLDNCSAHPPAEDLDVMYPNIQIWMLPPNTTALIQPMDQGVIMVLKSKVKKMYYDKLVAYNLNTNYDYEKKIIL